MRIEKIILDLKRYMERNNLTPQDKCEAECRYLDVINVRALNHEWLYNALREEVWVLKRLTLYEVIEFLKKLRDMEIKNKRDS